MVKGAVNTMRHTSRQPLIYFMDLLCPFGVDQADRDSMSSNCYDNSILHVDTRAFQYAIFDLQRPPFPQAPSLAHKLQVMGRLHDLESNDSEDSANTEQMNFNRILLCAHLTVTQQIGSSVSWLCKIHPEKASIHKMKCCTCNALGCISLWELQGQAKSANSSRSIKSATVTTPKTAIKLAMSTIPTNPTKVPRA